MYHPPSYTSQICYHRTFFLRSHTKRGRYDGASTGGVVEEGVGGCVRWERLWENSGGRGMKGSGWFGITEGREEEEEEEEKQIFPDVSDT